MKTHAIGICAQSSGMLPPFERRVLTVEEPVGRDLLISTKAYSINPVDTKRRASAHHQSGFHVLGWDTAGIVAKVGPEVQHFKEGDEVYYAGDISRSGSQTSLHLVDERIVSIKPERLSMVEAATIPLTALTAYEAIFERLKIGKVTPNENKSILVIGGAGGVGSMAIQFAKLVGLHVVATASRPESEKWVRSLGADNIISHEDLLGNSRKSGFSAYDYILNTQDTAGYWNATAELIAPEGHIVSIVETSQPLNLTALMEKSATFSWELMFTKSLVNHNAHLQRDTLSRIAAWIDEGKIRHTMTMDFGELSEHTLNEAHALQRTRRVIGKIGFSAPAHFKL